MFRCGEFARGMGMFTPKFDVKRHLLLLSCCVGLSLLVFMIGMLVYDNTQHASKAALIAFYFFFSCLMFFGPLLGIRGSTRPESCRCAIDLALVRVIFLTLYLQDWLWRERSPALTSGPGEVLTGLPAWTGLSVWSPSVLRMYEVEHILLPVAAVCSLLGLKASWALKVLVVLEVRSHALLMTYTSVGHGRYMYVPWLSVLSLSPCEDALCLLTWLTSKASDSPYEPGQSVNTPHAKYTFPFVCMLAFLSSAYLSAGWAKLTDCGRGTGGGEHGWPFASIFWTSSHFRDILHKEYFRKCTGSTCMHPSNTTWRPLCLTTLKNLFQWLRSLVGLGPHHAPPVFHATCLLGDNYLFPIFRIDQMFPPWMMHLGAFAAVVWEMFMFVAVLYPGVPRLIFCLMAFIFHQSVYWFMYILFGYLQDYYLVLVPWRAVFNLLRSRNADDERLLAYDAMDKQRRQQLQEVVEDAGDDAEGVPKDASSESWFAAHYPRADWRDSRWRIAAFTLIFCVAQMSTVTIHAYPFASFPDFCPKVGRDPGEAPPKKYWLLREVRLVAKSPPGRVLYQGAPFRRYEPLAVKAQARGRSCSSWTDMVLAIRDLPVGLGMDWHRVSEVHFVNKRIALDISGNLTLAQQLALPPILEVGTEKMYDVHTVRVKLTIGLATRRLQVANNLTATGTTLEEEQARRLKEEGLVGLADSGNEKKDRIKDKKVKDKDAKNKDKEAALPDICELNMMQSTQSKLIYHE